LPDDGDPDWLRSAGRSTMRCLLEGSIVTVGVAEALATEGRPIR
jgi:hypothetical protein